MSNHRVPIAIALRSQGAFVLLVAPCVVAVVVAVVVVVECVEPMDIKVESTSFVERNDKRRCRSLAFVIVVVPMKDSDGGKIHPIDQSTQIAQHYTELYYSLVVLLQEAF